MDLRTHFQVSCENSDEIMTIHAMHIGQPRVNNFVWYLTLFYTDGRGKSKSSNECFNKIHTSKFEFILLKPSNFFVG